MFLTDTHIQHPQTSMPRFDFSFNHPLAQKLYQENDLQSERRAFYSQRLVLNEKNNRGSNHISWQQNSMVKLCFQSLYLNEV